MDGFLARVVTPEKRERVEQLFRRHGQKIILLARFLPGVRAVTYFVAGTTGVPYWKFIFYDALAACVSAPFWVLLGHWAGKHRMLHKAWHLAKEVQLGIILAVAGVLVIWAAVALVRKQMRKARAPATLSAIPGGRARSEPPPLKRTNEA